MKKYVLFGILAVALLAIPMVVAADVTTTVTLGTGAYNHKSLTCGATSTFVNLGGAGNVMSIGYNPGGVNPATTATAIVTATVDGSVNHYYISAKDPDGLIGTGYLVDYTLPTPTFFARKFMFGWGTGTATTPASGWQDLSLPKTILSSSVTTGSQNVFFDQLVNAGDPAGTWTKSIEFDCVMTD